VPDPESVVDIIDERFGLSKQLPESTDDGDDFDTGNYFRSKEVMHKIRRQQIIETPLFSLITEEARQRAYAAIPPELVCTLFIIESTLTIVSQLEEAVDRSDEAYNASHAAPLKKEQHVRVSETDNFKYRRHRLKDRIKQLSGLDSSYFRGDTNEEQERDRGLVLAAAAEILEQIDGTKQDEGSDEEFGENTDAQPRVNGVHGSKKSNKKQQSAYQDDLDESGAASRAAAPKPEKKKRKASTKVEYYDEFEGLEDVIGGFMDPYPDEEDQPTKKLKKKTHGTSKKGATLGKRKRVPEVDMDLEEYEEQDYEHITPTPSTKRLKSEASSHGRLASHSLPPSIPANSGLLDQARKYNPDRPSRDLHPFGAPFDWKLLRAGLDFQLPASVALEEEEDGYEDEPEWKPEDEDGEATGEEAAVEAKTDTVESVLTEDVEGEDEIVQNGQPWDQNAGDSSSPLSSVDDGDEDDDGETEPGL